MNKKIKVALILLTIIGFMLRAWKIDSLPFPPDGDEVAFGYYGWSLLKYGTDEFGNKFPLFFSSIGDNKYPGLAYLNILPAFLFGLSDITTRFWSVISATFAIPLIYFISYYFTKNKKASLFSSLIFTFSPWSLIESRIGYENHVSFVITLAAIILLFVHFGLIKAKYRRLKKYSIYIAILLFLISILTYAAQRIFIPLFLFSLFTISFFDSNFKKIKRDLFLIFVLITTISIILFLNPKLRGRSGEEIWKFRSEDLQKLELTYHSAGISPIKVHPRVTWFLHNKYAYSVQEFIRRYADHFSYRFLFSEGEASDENIPNMGVLLLAEIIFLPAGILTAIKKGRKESYLLFVLLLISPIPSSLTGGGAHINRASLMIVPLSILSGSGLWFLVKQKLPLLKKVFVMIILSFLGWSILYTLHQIFIVKPVLRPWYKQQVNRDLTMKVLNLKEKYDKVVVGDDDYIYYLFYGKISPNEFLSRAEILPLSEGKWERVNRLDNIYFKMPYKCPLSGKGGVLYVCEGEEIPQNSKLIDIVYYWDGVPAYTFIEFYPLSERPDPLPLLPERLHYMVGVEKPDGNPDGIIPEEDNALW